MPRSPTAGCERVLSIAAGVTLARLQAALGGASPSCGPCRTRRPWSGRARRPSPAGTAATDDDLAWAEAILAAVGTVVRVPEHLLDAVTGLSGSGPAYVFLVAEALIEAGVLVGLPRDVSAALATQTLLGAARLLAETGDSPEALRAMVTSPGGTTAAGSAGARIGRRPSRVPRRGQRGDRAIEAARPELTPPRRRAPDNTSNRRRTVSPAEEGVFPWRSRKRARGS